MGGRQKARRQHVGLSRWAVALATSIGLVVLWLAPAARAASCNTSGGRRHPQHHDRGRRISERPYQRREHHPRGRREQRRDRHDDPCHRSGRERDADDQQHGRRRSCRPSARPGGAFDDDDDFVIDLSSGTDTLVITGDSTADTITLTPFASNRSDITQTGVENFSVFGGAGDDIVNGGTFATALTLNGGAGNDQLTGGIGNDTLNGGDGNDLINGNAGTDLLTYGSTVAGVTVDLATTVAQKTVGSGVDTLTGVENLTGTPVNDFLTGSPIANSILGGSGDDVDRCAGGPGNDTVVNCEH